MERKGKEQKKTKICFVCSSGGHYEELINLSPLMKTYDGFFVTEKTQFKYNAKYFMPSTGSNDIFVLPKMFWMQLKAFYIWIKEKPDVLISTGAMICIPFWIVAKLFKKKVIFIETYARIHDKSKTGAFMYKHADLFIVQWESLLEVYPNAVYGGTIF